MRKTVLIQAAGYPVLLALIYEWLGIADRSVWQVVLSAVLALAIVCGAVWLVAQALGVRVIRALLWVAAAAAIVACCVRWPRPWLWVLGLAAVLAILPVAAGASSALRAWRYWLVGVALVAAGVALPWLLVRWVPKFQGFGAQTASMILRFGIAYGIALAAWLGIASLPRASQSNTFSRPWRSMSALTRAR